MQFSNKKNKFSFKKLIIICIVLGVCYLLIPFFRQVTLKVFSPLFVKSNQIKDSVSEQSFFRKKISMRKEIEALKEENQRLTLGLQNTEEIKRENEELRSIVGRVGKNTNKIMLPIIAKPNQSPYDTLIVSLDTNKSIKVGSFVLTEPESIVGTVDSTDSSFATISLFSKSERITVGRLERTKQDINLIGRGGGNFIVEVPVDTDVVLGDRIIYPSFNNTLIGVVRNISDDDRNPSKILHVTSFVNILNLSDIYVVE